MKTNRTAEAVKETLAKVAIVKNLSRKKFIWQFIKGLIKVRDVRFSEIAIELNDSVKVDSNERRIQAFFEKCVLDYDLVAILLVLFLPKGKVLLSMDRTEWDFGQFQINNW